MTTCRKAALLLLVAVNFQSILAAPSPAAVGGKRLSEHAAQQLAQVATKSFGPDLYAHLDSSSRDGEFYVFEISAHYPPLSPYDWGRFSVNALTGEVWDIIGDCTRLNSGELRTMQAQIRSQLQLPVSQIFEGQRKKPECNMFWGGKSGRLSQSDAKRLAQVATRIYFSDLVAVTTNTPRDGEFYIFQILFTGGTRDVAGNYASPVFGGFAVNAWTGDVWNVAGYCTHLKSPTLRHLQVQIRAEWALPARRIAKLRNEKPACDAE